MGRPSTHRYRGTVLIVDDEALIRWSAGERLTRAGYEVLHAETGEEAIALLTSSTPELLLLDVRLPGIDGVAALRHALELRPHLAVVMMSAHASIEAAVEAMKLGATDFLVKPFSLDALEAAVDRALSAALTRRRIAELALAGGTSAGELVGVSPAMEQVRALVSQVARTDAATVLIEGETGCGKEMVARSIHARSARAHHPFLQVNCAAVPEQLLESELFGHERGAFTDARVQKLGIFESAEGGTVLLDELGELPAAGQAKLLRSLENRTFRRVGGVEELRADVRVLAATNIDLERRVAEGGFRPDLFFRLNVVRIRIPPLRERPEDIPLLAASFIARLNADLKRSVSGVAQAAMHALLAHCWPGNARELRNVLERAFILHHGMDEVRLEHLPPEITHAAAKGDRPAPSLPEGLDLADAERRVLADAIRRADGNQTRAARMLGITRFTLRYRLRKHGIPFRDGANAADDGVA